MWLDKQPPSSRGISATLARSTAHGDTSDRSPMDEILSEAGIKTMITGIRMPHTSTTQHRALASTVT
ncbi:hypothetical protein GCM10009850_074730 [Nonomuraea monospora]|uniref:Uncharacterized protein n=1 Tax=Nonomuraea monospora TaxID=568818 RepID=A0ABN3CRS6_9ACTN